MAAEELTPGPERNMRFAYADPPYLGCCALYDHYHPDGLCWDHLTFIGDAWKVTP